MTDTTHEGSSDGKPCADCGLPIVGDQRYSRCPSCRGVKTPAESGDISEVALNVPETPSNAPINHGEPIVLDIEANQPPAMVDRDFYWCGATADCPMDITLGGFEFPKHIGRVRERDNGTLIMEEDYRKGVVHRMTERQKAIVLEHAANKIIRGYQVEELQLLSGGVKTRYRGMLLGKTGSKHRLFEPQMDDKPLGQFVYMVKVRSKDDRPDFGSGEPPTMVARDW